MSKDEVVGFSDFGPYKSFRNGDVETYNGLFDGRKGNVQFFFNDSGLRRIGVYEYEGKDGTLANAAWMRSYGSLKSLYGEVETPWAITDPPGSPVDAQLLALAAGAQVQAGLKIQMKPVKQPAGITVFSSYFRQEVNGATYYYVIIYLDSRL